MKSTINRLMTFQLYLCGKRSVYLYVNITLNSSLCCFQVYACMMVFFLSNMIENQLMSTGAFEITFNGELFTIYCNFWAGTGLFCLQSEMLKNAMNEFDRVSVFDWLIDCPRCTCVVQTGIWSSAIHATACANPGQRDEDERSHEHKTTSLLTLLASWLEFKVPHVNKMLVFCFLFSVDIKQSCFFNNILENVRHRRWSVAHRVSLV